MVIEFKALYRIVCAAIDVTLIIKYVCLLPMFHPYNFIQVTSAHSFVWAKVIPPVSLIHPDHTT